MSQQKRDMTSGKILPQLILFALPLLGSSLVQQMYNTADLLFVGNFAGKTAAAAVGSCGLIFTCLIGLFTGISVGVGIVIAQAWGADKKEEAQKTVQTAMVISFCGSIVLMGVGLCVADKILVLLQTPKEILEEAVIYVKIYFLSMVPMVLYNMGSSILRACGESKTPFYILIAGSITNIIADAVLVAVFRLGVAGAAIATSISQTVSAVCMVWYLMSSHSRLRLSLKQIHIESGLLKKILNYGLPAGIQAVVVTISNVMVQYYINGYGEDAVASYAAYFKIEDFIYLPVMACGQAIMTFVGQNYGAGCYQRIKKGTFEGLMLSYAIAVAVAAVILAMPEKIVGLFIKDHAVIAYGVSILRTTFPLYWLCATLEVMGGVLRGMGYSHVTMATVLTGLCAFRISLLYFINRMELGFYAVASVYPMTWVATSIGLIVGFLVIMRKQEKRKMC